MMNAVIDSLQLATTYKPIFVFSKEEKYYPCSVEYLLSHSQLYKENTLIKNFGELTPEELSRNVGDSLKVHPNSYRGQIESAPIYYFIRTSEKFIDIVFFIYFTYNGPLSILGKKVGAHDTDLEHIVVRVDTLTQLIAVYFSAHGSEGRWVMKDSLQLINNNVLIYVAKSSHAMYPTNGRQWRVMGLANDKTDFGLSWTTDRLIEVKDNDPVWMKYVGKWSREGIDSVASNGWWRSQSVKSSNWFTRFIPLDCIVDRFSSKTEFNEEQTKVYFKHDKQENLKLL